LIDELVLGVGQRLVSLKDVRNFLILLTLLLHTVQEALVLLNGGLLLLNSVGFLSQDLESLGLADDLWLFFWVLIFQLVDIGFALVNRFRVVF